MFSELIIFILIVAVIYCITRITQLEKKLQSLEDLFWQNRHIQNSLENDTKASPFPEKEEPVAVPDKDTILSQQSAPSLITSETVTVPKEWQIEAKQAKHDRIDSKNSRIKPKSSWLLFAENNFITILGVLTFVLGIGYFVKYAIDQHWISETFRVVIGLIVGSVVLGIAHKCKDTYRVFSSILVSGGISIFYITITLAFQEYQLINQTISFILLSIITLLAMTLSLVYNRQELIVFSIVGGFLAPLMVSTGESNYPFLFTYLALLNAAGLFIYYQKNWKILPYLHFVCITCYLMFWLSSDGATSGFIVVLFLILYAQLALFALLKIFDTKENEIRFGWMLFANQFLFTSVTVSVYHYDAFFIYLLWLLPNLALLLYVRKKSEFLENIFYAIMMSCIALAIPYKIMEKSVGVVWLVYGCVVLYIYLKSKRLLFLISSCVLILISFVTLNVFWIFETNTWELQNVGFYNRLVYCAFLFVPIFLLRNAKKKYQDQMESSNQVPTTIRILFTILAVAYTYLVLSVKLQTYQTHVLKDQYGNVVLLFTLFYFMFVLWCYKVFQIHQLLRIILLFVGGFLSIIYILSENIGAQYVIGSVRGSSILLYYTYLIPLAYFVLVLYQTHYLFDPKKYFFQWLFLSLLILFVASEMTNIYVLSVFQEKSIQHFNKLIDQYYLLVLPILLGLIAFALLLLGLKKSWTTSKQIAYLLLAIIIVKLYFFDVWNMDHLYRIIAFVALGLLLLLISFTYQKWSKILK